MDIQLVRTFLEVHRTRHFARAADTLCVSQAAVSARISQLEELVGAPLFLRQRNNLQLTPAGEGLLPRAETLMAAWNGLLLHSAGAVAGKEVVALGCLPSISEIFFEAWLGDLTAALPDVLLQLEVMSSATLLARIKAGSLDLALLYEDPGGVGLSAQRLLAMPLVLVSTQPIPETALAEAFYVHLNWGAAFDMRRRQPWEEQLRPALRIESPRLARQVLLQRGGVACLPLQQVQGDLLAGRLHRLDFAAPVVRELYLVHGAEVDESSAVVQVVNQIGELVRREGA